MSKRKFSSDAPLPRKKAKLAQIHDFEEYDTLAAPSPPSSQTMPSRREKRKRTDHLHINSDDEPSAKRTKTDQSSSDATSDSRNSSPEPWPSIGYAPEEEKEPNPLVEEFYRSCIETDVACNCQTQTMYRNPLPSPEPSERDTSDIEAIEHIIIHTTPQMRCPVSKPQQMLHPKLQQVSPPNISSSKKKSRSPRRQIERRSPPSSHQEQSRQQRRKKKNENQGPQRDEKPAPTIEGFLQSKRSSRRDSKCELWHLSDNGTACAVRSIRR